MTDEIDKVCGVDRDLLERMLVLLRDRYPEVDKANFFLESHVDVSGINIGVTNQRDAFSHLITMVTQTEMSRDEKVQQIGNAEEHLRRAIFEPYSKAVTIYLKRVLEQKEVYARRVLKVKHPGLKSAPPLSVIDTRLRGVRDSRARARVAKGRNKWDAEWEAGITGLVQAFGQLADLEQTLADLIVQADQIRSGRMGKIGVYATIGLGILGVAISVLLAKGCSLASPFPH